jgi:hypothetical protein
MVTHISSVRTIKALLIADNINSVVDDTSKEDNALESEFQSSIGEPNNVYDRITIPLRYAMQGPQFAPEPTSINTEHEYDHERNDKAANDDVHIEPGKEEIEQPLSQHSVSISLKLDELIDIDVCPNYYSAAHTIQRRGTHIIP